MTEPITGPEVYTPKLVSQAAARKFVSQNGRGYVAIGIFDTNGNAVDPDPDTLRLKVYFDDTATVSADPRGVLIADVDTSTGSDVIVRDEVGKYHYNIGPTHTAQRGLLTAEWTYDVGTDTFAFIDNLQILDQMPVYEKLREDTKLIVEQTSWLFADLFDSTTGGPWLQENFQTHFTYERIAQLMGQAVMKLNVLGYPVTNYGVGIDDPKIPQNFSALTVWATKLEVIRHLIRSYTEQPDFRNVQTTYTDRRDYAQRWQAVLADEKPEFETAVKMTKRSLLNLGRGSLLVAGGIYGGAGRGFFIPGMYAAHTRAFRFYPAAPSVSWGNAAFGTGR